MNTGPALSLQDRYLLDDALVSDPYSYLSQLREFEPVHWSTVHRAWLVTSHQAIMDCVSEPALSSDRITTMRQQTAEGVIGKAGARTFDILAGWMVFVDPPEHRRLRDAFRGIFNRRQSEAFRPLVAAESMSLLSDAKQRGREMDLVADYARPLAANVSARWLGVPETDLNEFTSWSADVGDFVLGSVQSNEESERTNASLTKLFDYLLEMVRDRQSKPQEDMVSEVLGSGYVGTEITVEEFVSMLTHLSFAGSETTSNLVTNGMRALLQHPEQLLLLKEQPEAMTTAVEELLRFDGPSKMSIRYVQEDFSLAGSNIASGDRVYLVTAAGNRDPKKFDRPDQLDLLRSPNQHLGFGHGIHFCLGATLARVIASAAFQVLVKRAPRLALADAANDWQPSLLNRSLNSLPVRLSG